MSALCIKENCPCLKIVILKIVIDQSLVIIMVILGKFNLVKFG